MASKKEITSILRAIEKIGGTVKMGGRGHWKVYNTDGHLVTTIASSPSQSARDRIRKDLARGGLFITL